MKSPIAIALVLALTSLIGCQSSGTQGGSATKEEGVRISVPNFQTNVKQGEVTTVTASLDRGDNFKQDVKLEIKATPGITVEPSSITIKASDKPVVQLIITAAKDAPLGDCHVYVKGTPSKGMQAMADFSVKVVAP